MITEKPEEIKEYLGKYGPQVYDGYCGEPVAWGFRITKHMGEPLFDKCRREYDLECTGFGQWFVITKRLTKEEAIQKYGDYQELPRKTNEFESVMFGQKRFIARKFVKQVKSCNQ